MDNEQSYKRAERLLERLMRQADDALWNCDDIATFTSLAKTIVQTKIICARGFPRAVIIPSGGRRWVAKEVKDFLKRQREPLLGDRPRRALSSGPAAP